TKTHAQADWPERSRLSSTKKLLTTWMAQSYASHRSIHRFHSHHRWSISFCRKWKTWCVRHVSCTVTSLRLLLTLRSWHFSARGFLSRLRNVLLVASAPCFALFTNLFVLFIQSLQLFIRELFNVDEIVAGGRVLANQFVQLQVQGLCIAILCVLNQEHHQKGHDGVPVLMMSCQVSEKSKNFPEKPHTT